MPAVSGQLVQPAKNAAITAAASTPCATSVAPRAAAPSARATPKQAPMARTGMISPPLKPPANVSKVRAAFMAKAHHGRSPPERATDIWAAPVPQKARKPS